MLKAKKIIIQKENKNDANLQVPRTTYRIDYQKTRNKNKYSNTPKKTVKHYFSFNFGPEEL